MPSSPLPEALEAARSLSPTPVVAVVELAKGNNARVFRVDTAAARYALKKYPAADSRDRWKAEVDALRFFARRQVARTPRVVAVAPEQRYALLSWVEGEAVGAIADADVDAFARFQIAIDRAADTQARGEIGEASEACLCGGRIVSQIAGRVARLEAVKADVAGFASFFDGMLVPSLADFTTSARRAYDRLGLDFDRDIAGELRTLIPSDLGAHNALRGEDGGLWFLDFEYFGWDDPVTGIANFVLHPGMQLAPGQQELYTGQLLRHFDRHGEAERLQALLPLFALRWCVIILGELLPERWRHRRENNAPMDDWDGVRRLRLDAATRLLARFTR